MTPNKSIAEQQTAIRDGERLRKTRTTAVRRINFCAGHRVLNHEMKCKYLHGHNYQLFVHAECEAGLDALGRVIDFSVLKHRVGDWIEHNWDHGTILFAEDVELIAALSGVPNQKLYVLPTNPTAENMAQHLLHEVLPGLMADTEVEITKVVLWETENCFVEVSL